MTRVHVGKLVDVCVIVNSTALTVVTHTGDLNAVSHSEGEFSKLVPMNELSTDLRLLRLGQWRTHTPRATSAS